MDFKNNVGYNLIPSEEPIEKLKEPITINESSRHGDEVDGENGRRKKNKKKGKKLHFKKSFWVCFSNVVIGSGVGKSHDDEKNKDKAEKKKNPHDDEFKFKVKDGFLFSNVEIEAEEDREKVLEVVEKMRNKSCFFICFSNIELGKGQEN